MTEQIERVAAELARRTESRRNFLGKFAKAGFLVIAGLAAGVPSSMLVEADYCNFPSGFCANCPMEGCPSGCQVDKSSHNPGYCWSVCCPYRVCCDCICSGSYCGCASHGVAPAA